MKPSFNNHLGHDHLATIYALVCPYMTHVLKALMCNITMLVYTIINPCNDCKHYKHTIRTVYLRTFVQKVVLYIIIWDKVCISLFIPYLDCPLQWGMGKWRPICQDICTKADREYRENYKMPNISGAQTQWRHLQPPWRAHCSWHCKGQ